MPSQEDDGEICLPNLKDTGGGCVARPSQKPVDTIHFITPSGSVQSYQYVHMDSGSRFEAGTITLRFFSSKPVEVMITGQQLGKRTTA